MTVTTKAGALNTHRRLQEFKRARRTAEFKLPNIHGSIRLHRVIEIRLNRTTTTF